MKIEKITHMTIELDFFLHINHPVVSPTRLSKRPLSGLKTMFSMETTSEKHVPNQIDLWVIMRIGGCCCKAEPHTFNVLLITKPLNWLRFVLYCLLIQILDCRSGLLDLQGHWLATECEKNVGIVRIHQL